MVCVWRKYFPYTLTVYSKLYMLQEIGIWVMFFVMTVMVTGIIGDRGVIYKLLTLLAIMLYSIVFGLSLIHISEPTRRS